MGKSFWFPLIISGICALLALILFLNQFICTYSLLILLKRSVCEFLGHTWTFWEYKWLNKLCVTPPTLIDKENKFHFLFLTGCIVERVCLRCGKKEEGLKRHIWNWKYVKFDSCDKYWFCEKCGASYHILISCEDSSLEKIGDFRSICKRCGKRACYYDHHQWKEIGQVVHENYDVLTGRTTVVCSIYRCSFCGSTK